jgi:hypothetical protein
MVMQGGYYEESQSYYYYGNVSILPPLAGKD